MAITRLKGFNLSIQQARLWALQETRSGMYLAQCAIQISGLLDKKALLQAIQHLVNRHSILRTSFLCMPGMDVPVQTIHEQVEVGWICIDLENLLTETQSLSEHTCFHTMLRENVDLTQCPLLHVRLFCLSADIHVLTLGLPSLCADDQTLSLLMTELCHFYARQTWQIVPSEDLEEALEYVDVAAWQDELLAEEEAELQRQYWQKIDLAQVATTSSSLAGKGSQGDNGVWKGSDRGSFFPEMLEIPLEPALALQLEKLAEQYHIPLSTYLFACWYLTCLKVVDDTNITIGTAFDGRFNEELLSALGPYTNYVPINIPLADDVPFEQMLLLTKAILEEAYERQLYFRWDQPSSEEARRKAGYFPVSFSFEQWPASWQAGGISCTLLRNWSCSEPFAVQLQILQVGQELQVRLGCDPRLFPRQRLLRLARLFGLLLEQVSAQPQTLIGSLALVDAQEREHLFRQGSGPQRQWPEQDLCQLVEQQARRQPDALAARSLQEELSYQQLNTRANQLAAVLRSRGVGPNVVVGLCLPREASMLVALLGVLKAGGAYLPLDGNSPAARLAYQLQESQARLLLTREALRAALPPWSGPTLTLEELAQELASAPDEDPAAVATGQDLAYVMYTSGSTGMPKGVLISRGSMMNYTYALCERLAVQPGWQYATVSTLAADLGNTVLFCALASGGCVQVLSYEQVTSGQAMAQWARQHPIDVLKIVPSHLAALLEGEQVGAFVPRQALVLGGEALPFQLIGRLAALGVGCAVYNHYGPTETTIGVLVQALGVLGEQSQQQEGGLIALGHPIANTRIYVLDGYMQLVPPGVRGELYIGGAGLAWGYSGQGGLTAQRFVPDPFSAEPGTRLYRTGDLVRWSEEGQLSFEGRGDGQVKLRGYRIEVGEIEAVLRQHPQIRDGVVMLRKDATDEPRLVSYVIGKQRVSIPREQLKEWLRQRLPEYMLPAEYMQIDELPLTANGKVDRDRLPRPLPEQYVVSKAHEAVQLRSPLEEMVAQVWRDLLGVPVIGAYDDFFALGGHSLLATRVIARLQATLQVTLPVQLLFEAPTVATFAQQVEQVLRQGEEVAIPPLVAGPRPEQLPLSFAQQRLWFLEQLEPGSPAYLVPAALKIEGQLVVSALERSMQELVKRHESLRTIFGEYAGQPVQVIKPAAWVQVPVIDLQSLPAEQRAALAQQIANQEGQRPCDLGQGPLLRIALLRLQAEEHVLLLTLHHIITDGWSSDLLVRELTTLYRAFVAGQPSPLQPLPLQYADYALWQRTWLQGAVLEKQLAYWRSQLTGAPYLALPTDYPRPSVQTSDGASQRRYLPVALTQGLWALSQQEHVTSFMTLLAAFQVLLARYTGQHDISVGTPIANRRQAESEGIIGFFVNTLVMRTDLSGDPSFVELLQRVRKISLEAYAHQDVPFESVVEAIEPARDLSRSPLFQVMFVLQKMPHSEEELTGVRLSPLRVEQISSKFDMSLFVTESEQGLACTLEYNTNLFEAETINRFLDHWQILLEGAVENPQARLFELPLLTVSEQEQLLSTWNATQRTYPHESSLQALFEQQVVRTPDAIAIADAEMQLSYTALNRRANQLARALRHQGIDQEERVGICLEHNCDLVIAILATLKAGATYVPLDPALPLQRRVFMLTDVQAKLLLTHTALADAALFELVPTIKLDQVWPNLMHEPAHNLAVPVASHQAAYVIYTSGSTGQPKGVVGSHRSLINRLYWSWQTYPFMSGERCCQKTSLGFVDAITELFAPLLQGTPVVLLDTQQRGDPLLLLEALAKWQVSRLVLVPSLLHTLLEDISDLQKHVPALQLWISSGEALTGTLARCFYDALPGRVLLNLYGSSEVAGDATAEEVRVLDEVIPIGRPLVNIQAYILDTNMRPVPVGVVGDLYIGGDGLARGYVNRPALTAERFVPHPFGPEPGARLYKTGDLARYRADGAIEYRGRVDQQVKIRGHRIELGEIEAVLGTHSALREVAVVARPDESGELRLVAYVVGQAAEAFGSRELRSYLQERLPAAMIPAAFVVLDALPLNSSGKVDRRALPELPVSQERADDNHAEARTPIEELIQGIWQVMLGRHEMGREENFFEQGGHSLLATRVIARVRNLLEIEIPLQALFEAPTIAGFAQRVEQVLQQGEGLSQFPLVAGERPEAIPLSFAQQRLWFLEQLEPGSTTYLLPAVLRVEGRIDVSALEHSIQKLVSRHESLRTVFTEHAGQPVQVIKPAAWVQVPVIDLQSLPAEQRAALAQQIANQEGQHPCDLGQGPLLRVALLRLRKEEHVLLLTLHHIITDGWSNQVLVRELTVLYQATLAGEAAPLAPLPVQYADYALWQRQWLQGEALERQLAYWREQLAGSQALDLPTDFPRPAMPRSQGASCRQVFSAELLSGLQACSRQEGVTLFMLLLASFQVLLARWSGQKDISVGTPIANRTHAEIEGVIGFFANTLVLRSDLSGNPAFRQVLQQVREVCLGAYAHQDVPFEQVVEALQPQRDLSRSPLFQVMLVLQEGGKEAAELDGVQIRSLPQESQSSKFDLTLSLQQVEQELYCHLEYRSDLFAPETMQRLLEQWQILLEGILHKPAACIWDLPLLSTQEQALQLVQWNATRTELPLEGTVAQLFEQQAQQRPDAIALVFEGTALTYGELNRRANILARYLQTLGVCPEIAVGVYLERCLEMVVGLLGILKAGGVYVPFDPDYPAERLAFMTQDAQVTVLVTKQELCTRLPVPLDNVLCLDRFLWEEQTGRVANLSVNVQPENLVYMIYTSGSTGKPKGAMNVQQGLVNRLLWMQQTYPLIPGDRVLQKTPFSFDVSVWEFFWPLITGASLVMAQPHGHQDPAYLKKLIQQEQVSIVHFIPSMLQAFLLEPTNIQACAALRQVFCSGEALSASLQARFFELSATTLGLHNLYGPTEASIEVTFWDCLRDYPVQSVPIGRPIANLQIYVLDARLQLLPTGAIGELYIGGVGLARGYWQRPDLTAERFVPHPWSQNPGERLYRTGDLVRYRKDGALEFVGRKDGQVKLRGYRIELGEIEACLGLHPGVRECIVTAREDHQGEKRLVAYLVAQQSTPSSSELRRFVMETLPEYMAPAAFVFLDELPHTPNGKVDLRALPQPRLQPAEEQERALGLRTPIEELVATIWSEVLGVEQIGQESDFFRAGGHSLVAFRMISRLRTLLGIEIELRTIFAYPTLVEFAGQVEQARRLHEGLVLPALRAGVRPEEVPLSFAQQRLWLLDQLEPGRSTYLVSSAYRMNGTLDPWSLERSLEALIQRHESLRTTFRSGKAGLPIQVIHTVAGFVLPVIDLQALGRQRRVEESQLLARQVAQQPLDLVKGPLMCVYLLRQEQQEHVILLTLHHIITDGWSNEVLARELMLLYQAYCTGQSSPLPSLPIQYADYALWQRQWLQGEVLQRQIAYWKKQLWRAQPLKLPTDVSRDSVQSNHGSIYSYTFSTALWKELVSFSQRESVTMFMLLLTVFQALLYRLSGQTDIVVGTDTANRTHVETEGLIGFFVNLLALRTNIQGTSSFHKLLQQVRATVLEAYTYQELPFDMVVEHVQVERKEHQTPLIQALFVMQNTPQVKEELPGIAFDIIKDKDTTARFDLAWFVHESVQGGDISIVYRTALFKEQTIATLLRRFEAMIQSVVTSPDASIDELEIITPEEKAEQASYEARLYSAGSRNWQKRRTNAIDLSALSLEAQEHAED